MIAPVAGSGSARHECRSSRSARPAGGSWWLTVHLLSCDFQSHMARERLPDTHQTGRRRRSAAALPTRGAPLPQEPMRQSPPEMLLTTWPGRLFLISASLKLIVALARVRRAAGLRPCHQHRGHDRSGDCRRRVRLAAVRADEASAALAGPSEADPVVHLHRRRAVAADHRVLPLLQRRAVHERRPPTSSRAATTRSSTT